MTIDEAKDEDYNWEIMALEEAADLFKYLVKQIKFLKKQNLELRYSQRKQLVDKVLNENLALAEENKKLKEERDFFAKLFVNTQLGK